MKKLRHALTALAALLPIAGCATTDTGPVEPMCRAPNAQEMQIFRAVIGRDRQTLIANSAQGPARNALLRNDPYLNNHLWGSQGYTGGTLLGVLTQPPPCVLDMPVADPATQREIVVYQRARYDALRPPMGMSPDAVMFTPYGTHRQDYFRCRFVNTTEGWRMTDLCALATAQGGIS